MSKGDYYIKALKKHLSINFVDTETTSLTYSFTKAQADKLLEYEEWPASMDDHWAVWVEYNRVFFVRSWTQLLAWYITLEEDEESDNWTGTVTMGKAISSSYDEKNGTIKSMIKRFIVDILGEQIT